LDNKNFVGNSLDTYSNSSNIASMSDGELEALMQKATDERIRRLTEKVNEVITVQSKQNQDLVAQREIIQETKEKADTTAEQISVIGFGIHSKKYKLLHRICCARIHEILGGMCDYTYILWNKYFYQRIYIDISDYFEVDGCKNINVKDYEKAKALACNWRPSDTYVHEKTQELIERRDKGQLAQNRCMALYMYLENTDSGKVNPF